MDEVRGLLGEPERVEGGYFTFWHWADSIVVFTSGKLDRWSEPATLEGADLGVLNTPLYAGIGGVTNPELIETTKVAPEYPDSARKAKISGKVVLQAVIKKDGFVGDIQVLQSPGSHFGFDEAAMAAVKQWRYQPATQDGKPVDVYFTIAVEFEKGR